MNNKVKEYYEELYKYEKLSKEAIKKGGGYLVVMLSHELYRFLYPYEPYEDIVLDKPIPFILEKIKKINLLLEQGIETIKFYKFEMSSVIEKEVSDESLEKNTSDVYTSLWKKFDNDEMLEESKNLIEKRIPKEYIEKYIKDKIVLDMGCGSGRYSVALSLLGAKKVYGIDLFSQSYKLYEKLANDKNLNIEFLEGNFHNLPFDDNSFDFIFSNGTIHHSSSIKKSLKEYRRVLKDDGKGFLYIYADGGIFWNTRKIMREAFKNIPIEYTNQILRLMGMPQNRFIFSDVWHVPIETHTTKGEIETLFDELNFKYKKLISQNDFDLDFALLKNIEGAKEMWGDGEHRYLLEKYD